MLTLLEAAQAISAQVSGPDVTFTGVTTDSRNVAHGDLFVALKGENFDGHEFVRNALGCGAVAAMVERAWEPSDVELPLLRVDDTKLALGRLAHAWRNRFSIPLVAITGSNGKTTVKEMLAAILRANEWTGGKPHGPEAVLATEGNLNNDIGLPLMLLRLREHHHYAVIEMGMNHRGEIGYLSRLADPDFALITNAHRAHLGFLGSTEGVAHAKGEIYEGLKPQSVALINADDPHAYVWRELSAGHSRIEFALSQPAPLRARYTLTGFGANVDFITPLGEFSAHLQVPGVHNVRNALAACATAYAMDIRPVTIAAGLRAFSGVKGRMQRKTGSHGALLIDDTYNANPDSVLAALEVLAAIPGEKIFVLGDMGEIGPEGVALHGELGTQAKALGIGKLYTLGELSAHAAAKFGSGAQLYVRVEDLATALKPRLKSGVTVLVKGSRFMRMERVVEALEAKD
jgi:UDP-N-acetylmuramoyl-tripeptide--D-alanyl-D-alanine ligase